MGVGRGAIRELSEAIGGLSSGVRQPTVADGVVTSTDGGTWVLLDGSEQPTPVSSSTVSVRRGDRVTVRIDGGKASVTGNLSRVSTSWEDTEQQVSPVRVQAVKAASDAAGAQKAADTAQAGVDATLIYDHTYDVAKTAAGTTTTFTAHLYRAGVDVASQYPAEWFKWYVKRDTTETASDWEDGNWPYPDGTGLTFSVSVGAFRYGGSVVGTFEPDGDAGLLSAEGAELTDADGSQLLARAAAEGSVRVTELPTANEVSTGDWLMGWGGSVTYRAQVSAYAETINAQIEELTAEQAAAMLTWD